MARRPITGQTRLAAVIGDPVRHSLSPAIHNAGFEALDLDWAYVALPVSAGGGADALAAMATFGLEGLSVTMPLKDEIAAAVDVASDAVTALGACNCVVRDGDRLVGHNTDGDGFVQALTEESGESVDGKSIAVVGAGGAARAIIDALGRTGAASIVVVNRTLDRAERAAALASVATVAAADQAVEAIAACDVVVNATSVGMGWVPGGSVGAADLPIPLEALRSGQVVADIVYQPLETPLLAEARARKLVTVGGVGMLVHQAAIAFEHWTGQPAPLDAMRAAVADLIS